MWGKTYLFLLLGTVSAGLWGQKATEGRDYIESTRYNPPAEGTERTLRYRPDGEDFVCHEGDGRFTRPLYGPHTGWRVETSDRPVFAVYSKPLSRHVAFRLCRDRQELPLDSTDCCEARYTPGRRTYLLSDSRWGSSSHRGTLRVAVLPLSGREGAIWYFRTEEMPDGTALKGYVSPIRAKKLNRNGDMGADPPDCFEAHPDSLPVVTSLSFRHGEAYALYEEGRLVSLSLSRGRKLYAEAEAAREMLSSRFRIETPDPWLNPLGGALAVAADAIWDGEVWLHGANGWRMPLSGWRAAYVGDCLGWTERARRHFDNYAASQVTEVPPVRSHPAQDTLLHLARAAKQWGTPMYSNGYICRNPRRNNQMHHYDMNLCYIDELLWHLCWTGDTAYARRIWPVLASHLAWEKRNFDPDNDALYDAYCCIWASDALYYNSGAVTHSSAYNYRANLLAARIAPLAGADPAPYAEEARRIREALSHRLWMADKGCWAEFQDFMGRKALHTSPGLWTVYHAIDSEVSNPFQYYLATRYVDNHIPHIPVRADGVEEGLYTLSTTDWMPYSWSINNVAFAEVWHTALAYWLAGRPDEACRLFKASVLDGMYLGRCPGNFGQISHYDAARGECYRDFGDPVGVAARVLVQGLFGVRPDLLEGRVDICPGFPASWDHAAFHAPYLDYSFRRRDDGRETYHFSSRFARPATLCVTLPVRTERLASLTVNGLPVEPRRVEVSVGMPRLLVECPPATETEIVLQWAGEPIDWEKAVPDGETHREGSALFVRMRQGEACWWEPLHREEKPAAPVCYGTQLPSVPAAAYRPLPMDTLWNASVTDIFRNRYESPRSPYTTLQIPLQGIGEWCHPKETALIDDAGLRAKVRDGLFTLPQGIPFRTPAEGRNIAFTSLWDNYPDSLSMPLDGKASGIYLLMAGSTNHMQCHQENGRIIVTYRDNTCTTLSLVNPENWPPIEQDFYMDALAFRSAAPRPWRVALASGTASDCMEETLSLQGFNDRRIPGGAATLLYLPLDSRRELARLTLETCANEVVVGLMAATLRLDD